MFFESADFDFKILCVLKDNRPYCLGNSGNRPFYALSFRIEGDAVFESKGISIKAQSGDLMLCPKNCAYNIDGGKENLIIVHFDTNAKLPESLKKLSVSNPEIFERDFSRLYSAWSSKRIGFEHECKYILYKIFMNMERETAEISNNTDQISHAIDYIHEQFYDRDISISHLAKLCSMSDTYFRRLFKDRFGVTPLKYINNLRTSRAIELLQSGYYTVTETAEKCGFENVYYFSLFIKKETGKTPSQICNINK